MAPWTGSDMKRKGAKKMYPKAASMANAILRESGNEGMAIATALKHVNAPDKPIGRALALKHVNKPGARKARRRYPA